MSWITGLADKAENILNKLDQNAATALQTPTGAPIPTSLTDSNIESDPVEVIKKIYPANSLSLVKSLSAKQINNESSTTKQVVADPIEFNETSNFSSRRSSISSRPDSIAIDMAEIPDKTVNAPAPMKTMLEIQELAAFKIALTEISNERDELKAKLLALTDTSQQAVLQSQLVEMGAFVQKLIQERDQIQNELHDTLSANKGYMHSISQLESSIAKIQQDFLDVSKKLQMQVQETEQQRLDLVEYRRKAQLALQMKDQVITELKNAGTTGVLNKESSEHSNERVLLLELGTLKQENQQFQEEIENIRTQLEISKAHLHSICRQHEETLATLHSNDDILRKELRSEKERILQLESELRVSNQELLATRRQITQQMEAFTTKIQEKDTQLDKMKTNFAASQADPTNYETRIRSLTQTLVDKQNSVEAITTERNALKFQLEKAENQIRLSAYNTTAERNPLTLANHTDDVKAQFPILMRENPFDNRVARRVKRAYSTLDSAGIRLGAFLRRYPLMRIAVLMYVGLLHLWVMFVLLSSTPT